MISTPQTSTTHSGRSPLVARVVLTVTVTGLAVVSALHSPAVFAGGCGGGGGGGGGAEDCGSMHGQHGGRGAGHGDHGAGHAGTQDISTVSPTGVSAAIRSLGLTSAERQRLGQAAASLGRQAEETASQLRQKNRELYLLTHSPTPDRSHLESVTQELGALYAQHLQNAALAQQKLYQSLTLAQRQRLLQYDAQLLTEGVGCLHNHGGMAALDPSHSQCVATGSLLLEGTRSTGVASARGAAESAALYTCPMHPEVKSDKPGECPKCGMDLVKKKGN